MQINTLTADDRQTYRKLMRALFITYGAIAILIVGLATTHLHAATGNTVVSAVAEPHSFVSVFNSIGDALFAAQ
jgi:hypothetical protein